MADVVAPMTSTRDERRHHYEEVTMTQDHRRTRSATVTCAGSIMDMLAMAAVNPCWAAPADPGGTWLVKDGDARVRIEHCPRQRDRICGYLVWTKEAATGQADRDENNPDTAKRSRPVLGMQILLGLAVDGAAFSGQIYNAENGKTYDAHVTREDATHLTLKGCVLTYLCQSQTWTRVDDVARGQLAGPVDGPDGPRADAGWAQPKSALAKAKR